MRDQEATERFVLYVLPPAATCQKGSYRRRRSSARRSMVIHGVLQYSGRGSKVYRYYSILPCNIDTLATVHEGSHCTVYAHPKPTTGIRGCTVAPAWC